MKKIILTALINFTVLATYAQSFSGPPSFTPDVLDNPIDGGLGILLGAGVAYGANMLRNKRNRDNQDKNMED
jgi:hypothetical protein